MEKKDFILASASPYRLALLEQVALCPKLVCPADIDESCLRFETPSRYVKRMALEKARRVAALHPGENVLACDTVVVVGRRILHKAGSDEEQTRVMRLVSGRASHVLSAVCLINKNGREALRFSDSRVLTKRLSKKTSAIMSQPENGRDAAGIKSKDVSPVLSAKSSVLIPALSDCRCLKRRIY